jgi:hypothetical protein
MDVVARVVCVRWRGWRFIIKGLFQHLLSRVLSALVHSPRLFHIATFLPPHLEVALVTLQQAGENNPKRKNPGDRFIVVIILRQISWDDCGRNLTYELFHFYPPPLTLAAVIYIRWVFIIHGSKKPRDSCWRKIGAGNGARSFPTKPFVPSFKCRNKEKLQST